MSVFERGARPSSQLRKAVSLVVAAAIVVGAFLGCGGGEGVQSGATVTAYVEASLCSEAKKELAKQGGEAGDIRVQAVCLPSPHEEGKLDLATVGANARQATEDSTAIAFLEARDHRIARFTHPILETAEIPWITDITGERAMTRLLRAIEDAGDSDALRASVSAQLD